MHTSPPKPQAHAFDAAIVDLDGTMVDTAGDFESALTLALADLGQAPVGLDFIRRTIGKGSEHLIAQVLAQTGAPASLYEQAYARYQHHYGLVNGQHSAVYPGVLQGLQALRDAGLTLACLTNKPTVMARPLLWITRLASVRSSDAGTPMAWAAAFTITKRACAPARRSGS